MASETLSPAALDLLRLLAAHGIAYRRFDHAPVHTCEDTERLVPAEAGGIQTKNLFLRDKRGRRHFLLVTSCEKAVDLKALAPQVGADNLSFASPERLLRHLGVEPGAVTLLGLVHDREHAVEVIMDADLLDAETLRCHPLVNASTLVIDRPDVDRFFALTGHVPRTVEVPRRREG